MPALQAARLPERPEAVAADSPALLSAAVEDARAEWRRGWHDAARDKLAAVLTAAPADGAANALMLEVLFAQRAMRDAGPYLAGAEHVAAGDMRLAILRGEWQRACGESLAAEETFCAVLARERWRPGAWAGRISLCIDNGDAAAALSLLVEALAATAQDAWVWRRAVEEMFAAGMGLALPVALRALPVPAVAHAAFPGWADTLLGTGEVAAVAAALPAGVDALPAGLPVADRGALALRRAELAFAQGDFAAAAVHRRAAMPLQLANDGQQRQLLRDQLYAGNIPAANDVLAKMRPSARYKFGLRLLQEGRISAPAMAAVRDVLAGSVAARAEKIAALVLAEPGSLLLAIVFLHTLRHAQGLALYARHPTDGHAAVPARLWTDAPADGSWLRQHPGYLIESAHESAAVRAGVSALFRAAGFRKRTWAALPPDVRGNVERLQALHEAGGWWVPAARRCHGSLTVWGTPGTTCVFLYDSGSGVLLPEVMGCQAGHPAIAAALSSTLDIIRTATPGPGLHWESGAESLTLGVAAALAERARHGDACMDVRLVSQQHLLRDLVTAAAP